LSSVSGKIVIATRASALAIWQAQNIRERLLQHHPHLQVELLGMATQGDRLLSASLAKVGGKGLFVKELEHALAEQRADIAVHSMKDVPMDLPAGFALAAVTEREDPRDAFVSVRYAQLSALPAGASIGTSSLRRESQVRAHYPALDVIPLRGNVQTRLRKLDEGQYAAIILAAAGLKRLGLGARITAILEPEESLPAPGQGAIGVECLEERTDLMEMLAPLNHHATQWCVRAERQVSRTLSGSCVVPLGAFAQPLADRVWMRAFVASPDGKRYVAEQSEVADLSSIPEALGTTVAGKLVAAGARDILAALTNGE
jgi:hydroxymethylbilane synthase